LRFILQLLESGLLSDRLEFCTKKAKVDYRFHSVLRLRSQHIYLQEIDYLTPTFLGF
ncbi:hypothetical protein LINPERHAP1_LOCUS18904, partial [Linum perenne]